MINRRQPDVTPGLHQSNDSDPEADAVNHSRDELVAEADQFLDLSGADPETHTDGAAPPA